MFEQKILDSIDVCKSGTADCGRVFVRIACRKIHVIKGKRIYYARDAVELSRKHGA